MTKTLSRVRAAIAEQCPEALFADGFDEAILGLVERINTQAVCYDYVKCVKILMKRDGMDYEQAVEFMDFNVAGAYMGEHSPFFLYRHVP